VECTGLDWSSTCTYGLDKENGATKQQVPIYPFSCTAALASRKMGDIVSTMSYKELVRHGYTCNPPPPPPKKNRGEGFVFELLELGLRFR
jgi:hypothetical protein